MKNFKLHKLYIALLATGIGMFSSSTMAVPFIQCPGDNLLSDGVTAGSNGVPEASDPDFDPNVKCIHLSGGDGFARMADGRELYIFSFGDITGSDEADAIVDGTLFANMPAPAIVLEEGQQVYLTLTNVGMVLRPDLFDPHTVHFHGFPNASAIFDGVPDNSVSINVGSSLTYFYNIVEPGTYMYHCHVEAAEHMQMGMLGNLYVKPAQNKLADGTDLTRHVTHSLEISMCLTMVMDRHFMMLKFQFSYLRWIRYSMTTHRMCNRCLLQTCMIPTRLMNGRGYPDTVAGAITPPVQNGGQDVQGENALVSATVGQKILLRVSSLSTTHFFSLRALGLDMQVISRGARQLRTTSDVPNHYMTNTITIGGGEAIDVIIDTAGVTPGTYYLYTTNLNQLSNDTEDFGGMMTEIVIAGGA